jgi:hypothetical protein
VSERTSAITGSSIAKQVEVKGWAMQGRNMLLEEVNSSVSELDRDELKKRIKNFPGHFRMDFTDDYLDTASEDRLRHILLAAIVTQSPQ